MIAPDTLKTLPLWIACSAYVFYAYNDIGLSLAIFGFCFVWAIWLVLLIITHIEKKHVGSFSYRDVIQWSINRANALWRL